MLVQLDITVLLALLRRLAVLLAPTTPTLVHRILRRVLHVLLALIAVLQPLRSLEVVHPAITVQCIQKGHISSHALQEPIGQAQVELMQTLALLALLRYFVLKEASPEFHALKATIVCVVQVCLNHVQSARLVQPRV
jgi:hypothetical protein